jgi:GT2 family glycosyltransferase
MAKISLCIPACGRPSRLETLLDSLASEKSLFAETIVVDTTPESAKSEVLGHYKTLEEAHGLAVIRLPWAGPAEARAKAAQAALDASDYVLFLDEDLKSRPGNISRMSAFLDDNPSIACCSAQWIDHRPGQPAKRRPLGYVYVESVSTKPTVYKRAVHTAGPAHPPLVLHDLQASLLVRRAVLDKCSFDPNFDFFLELFDFFYALHKCGLCCAALPDVVFDHFPGQYRSGSQKRDADIKKMAAHDYFLKKWGRAPGLLRKGGTDE